MDEASHHYEESGRNSSDEATKLSIVKLNKSFAQKAELSGKVSALIRQSCKTDALSKEDLAEKRIANAVTRAKVRAAATRVVRTGKKKYGILNGVSASENQKAAEIVKARRSAHKSEVKALKKAEVVKCVGEDLPTGWNKRLNPAGRAIYISPSGQPQWTHPSLDLAKTFKESCKIEISKYTSPQTEEELSEASTVAEALVEKDELDAKDAANKLIESEEEADLLVLSRMIKGDNAYSEKKSYLKKAKIEKPKPMIEMGWDIQPSFNSASKIKIEKANIVDLTKTKMCKWSKEACKHGESCRFAHTHDELAVRECANRKECRHVSCTGYTIDGTRYSNNGDKLCKFIHPGETKDYWLIRIGLVKKQVCKHSCKPDIIADISKATPVSQTRGWATIVDKSIDEPKVTVDEVKSETPVQQQKVKPMCRSVAAGTACPYGSKCRFRHPVVSAQPVKKIPALRKCLLHHQLSKCLLHHQLSKCLLHHQLSKYLLHHQLSKCLLHHQLRKCLLHHQLSKYLLHHQLSKYLLHHQLSKCLLHHHLSKCLLHHHLLKCIKNHGCR
jgi:hypothetical protein